MKLPNRAMKLIRARLCGHNDLAAGLPTIFRGIRAGQYLELANSIQNGPVQWLIRRLVIIIDTVEQVLIRDFAVSRDVDPAAETKIRALCCYKYIRLQECEL